MLRSLVCAAVVLALAAPALANKKHRPRPAKEPELRNFTVEEAPEGDLFATFQTSMGDIIVKLYEKEAPKTVENFVGLASGKKEWKNPASGEWEHRPLYDGTFFHRVIPQFMIQGGDPFTGSGGDPSRAGTGGPGYRFEDELHNGHAFDKGGYLAMANSGPDTNGSQFFITEAATPHLNDKHTIFGEVISGFALVPKIAEAGNMTVKLVKVTVVRGTVVKSSK